MKKIGVGFAGAGWMGGELMKRLAERDDAEILALFQPNRASTVRALEAAGLASDLWTDDYDAMLERPEIEAVVIASPNRFHGEQAMKAQKAGKHVFCEKPCATGFDEFRRQIELERRRPEQITFVDYILYFDPMEQCLREMVAAGEFGKITQIQINYRHPVNIAGGKAWKLSRDLMGDAIGMGIVHSLSAMVWLMASQARPAEVFATSMEASVRPFEPEPVWNIMVRFDNGATGLCLGNIDDSNGYDAYHNLSGTEGGLIFDSQIDQPLKVRYWSQRATGRRWVYPLDAERCARENLAELAWPPGLSTPDSGNVIYHQTDACVGHFMECIRKREASPLSFARSAVFAEIGWAAQISAATGRPVGLPLDWESATDFFQSQLQPAAS